MESSKLSIPDDAGGWKPNVVLERRFEASTQARYGDRPPVLVRYFEFGERIRATLVVDAQVRERSTGGLRVVEEPLPANAELLARAMSWKFALARIPMGGAKGVLSLPPGTSLTSRSAALEELAAAVRDLVSGGRWMPAPDIGLPADDAARFLMLASDGTRRPPSSWWSSGVSTANAAAAAAEWGLRKRGKSCRDATIALVGAGSVGRPVAQLLERRGARVVAVATEHGAWHRTRSISMATFAETGPAERDAQPFSLAELLEQHVDVLVLAGPDLLLDAYSAQRVAASVVVPVSNLPATPYAEALLARRGVLLLPAPICSWGGVLSGAADRLRIPERARRPLLGAATRAALSSLWRQTSTSRTMPNLAKACAERAERSVLRATLRHAKDSGPSCGLSPEPSPPR